jgi:hypothetical protein
MKTCKKCSQDKPIESFTVDVRYKDGRYPWCADCRAAYRREKRYGANRDETLAYFQQWNDEHRDRKRELGNSNYARHKEAYSAHRRDYDRQRYHTDAAHRERKNQQRKARYQADPVERRRRIGYALISVNTRRARIAGTNTRFTQAEWRALCAKYNHRCLCCGQKKPLTPDHVTPLSRGGSNSIENIQPLCLECNMKKHALLACLCRLREERRPIAEPVGLAAVHEVVAARVPVALVRQWRVRHVGDTRREHGRAQHQPWL